MSNILIKWAKGGDAPCVSNIVRRGNRFGAPQVAAERQCPRAPDCCARAYHRAPARSLFRQRGNVFGRLHRDFRHVPRLRPGRGGSLRASLHEPSAGVDKHPFAQSPETACACLEHTGGPRSGPLPVSDSLGRPAAQVTVHAPESSDGAGRRAR